MTTTPLYADSPRAAAPAATPPSLDTLKANLGALAARSPRAVERIGRTQPGVGITFSPTDEPDAPTATLDGRSLASRRRPLEEAQRLASTIDPHKSGAILILGFGLGYHVRALAERLGRDALLVVYEPDATLLRAVLERINHAPWLASTNILILTDADNTAEMTESIRGLEALLSLGITIVEHPASVLRLGENAKAFTSNFANVVSAMRTHVITAMMQTDTTIRNLLMNVDHYASRPGITDLKDAAPGFPAIVVSAGPSLRRNIDRLASDPSLREHCVIIAVQTVLHQLLERGVKPHFVTALDYHEISRRFYEGLTPSDVEGITLVAEPKSNPAILDAYPGAIRMIESDHLGTILGPKLARPLGAIKPGATVAHLAYYLARHLGCDPVILVGQDLAFTDGQYYPKGASIHRVWSAELNPFNTLEQMEWQRIVRFKGHLHRVTDVRCRPVYTDDQMATYLAQFEADFTRDAERGLRTIDATEGGVRKRATEPATLDDALRSVLPRIQRTLPDLSAPTAADDASLRFRLRERIRKIRRDVARVRDLSRDAKKILERMAETRSDVAATNRLIHDVYALRDQVSAIEPAYSLVQRLNQTGAFKRFRSDRTIRLTDDLGAAERQSRQIERDIMNVSWLADVADHFHDLLGATDDMLGGAPKRTRDLAPSSANADEPIAARAPATVAALINTPHDIDPRNIAPMLARTLARLEACDGLSAIAVLTHDAMALRDALHPLAPTDRIRLIPYKPSAETIRARHSIRAARAFAPNSWRGGIAGLTIFDEALDPHAAQSALDALGCSAALVLNHDWTHLDPRLTNDIINRHRDDPDGNPLTFSQASPGLAPCIISNSIINDLAAARDDNHLFAHIGGMLGYLPVRPRTDPVAHPCCITVPPIVRDAAARFIEDHASSRPDGEITEGVPIEVRLARRTDATHAEPPVTPRELIIEITARRNTRPDTLARARGTVRPDADPEAVRRLLEELAAHALPVTFAGLGDPLLCDALPDLVAHARNLGLPTHIRTDALAPRKSSERLLAASPDIISIDMYADDAQTYAALTHIDAHADLLANLEHMLASRRIAHGFPSPWIVPRITRRDEVYEQIESFYDKWLILAGACVIDQLPEPLPGHRIEPLGKPENIARRDWRSRLLVLSNGDVIADEFDLAAANPVANAFTSGALAAWSALMNARTRALRERGPHAPELRTGW